MTKPKKPLRGLFASTEAPVQTPPSRPAIPVPAARKEQPKVPQKPQTPPERLAPPPKVKPVVPMMIMEEASSVQRTEKSIEPTAEVEVVEYKQEETIASQPTSEDERIMRIQYNFDSMRPSRENWNESDYAQFLRRLDTVQTEAFFLKGQLLAEAKNRFFETNRMGWAEYCENTLDMNYTTANQYIRVATEFDVTSHQRTDFGFEHFKALLPLPIESRIEFLNSAQPMSVKMIRTRVREIIMARPGATPDRNTMKPLRHSVRLIKMLETLKREVVAHGPALENLNQTQRWQLAAACQNIAAHLNHLAQSLDMDSTTVASGRQLTPRAGAFATADGVASMHDAATITTPTNSSN